MADNKNQITLDSLLSSQNSTTTKPIEVKEEEMIAEIERNVQTLTPEERQRVDEIKNNLNMQDTQQMSIYGSNAQKNIAKFSDQILSEVRSKDVGEVGDLMADLMVKVKDMDFDEVTNSGSFWDKLPFVKNTKNQIERYMAKYDVMQSQIDKIQAQLESSRMMLLKDIGTFDKLYEQNVDYFQELQLYIVAGEEKIREMREEVIPELFKQAQGSDDAMAMQVVKDFEDGIKRFEKRIFDMKTSKTIAIQTAPQIKLIQNNDKSLVDKVTDAVNNVIPLWKSQVVIALGLNRQGQVLEMQKNVSDTTNELLKRNAEKLQQNTIETAKEVERSTVDIETIKEVNQRLINTIEETITIQNNAKKARASAEVELMKVESDLKQAIMKGINA
ncbi:toxic anion resistance protein [Aerococcaceae bacterium DSM 111022]|nr:toxic anion resistance protein [Aerococcaceae bacterium DSM 111022]